MTFSAWKDAAELVGIFAIVVSLIFVGVQLQQDRNIALTGMSSNAVGNSAEIAALLQDNGDLWRRGLDGDELSEAERVEFHAIVASVEWHLTSEFLTARAFGGRDADGFIRDYAFALYVHPGLRRYFGNNIEHIESVDNEFGLAPSQGPFHSAVVEKLDELDRREPDTSSAKRYIFW